TAVVTLTPTTPAQPPAGFANGGYAVALSVADASTTPPTPVNVFALPVTVQFNPRPVASIPVISTDGGATWQALPKLTSTALPSGIPAGYLVESTGAIDVETIEPAIIALVPDTTPPTAPTVAAR